MASRNICSLIGNLTRDPEKREAAGKTVTKFAIAVNKRTKTGDETMFVDIVAWERLGDISAEYLKKGMAVLIDGRLSIRKYVDKEGVNRTAVEIIATDMQMLDRKNAPANGSATTESHVDDDSSLDTVPF